MRDDVFERCRYRAPREPHDIVGPLGTVTDGIKDALKHLAMARGDLSGLDGADESLAILDDLECVIDDIPPVLRDIESANDALAKCLAYWQDAAESLRDTDDDAADCLDDFEHRSPPIPDNTCPMIDGILSDLKSALTRVSRIESELEDVEGSEDALSNIGCIEQELGCLGRVLEEIRKSNEALRGCGRYWHVGAREIADTEEPELEP